MLLNNIVRQRRTEEFLTNIEFDEKTLKIDQIVNFDKTFMPKEF